MEHSGYGGTAGAERLAPPGPVRHRRAPARTWIKVPAQVGVWFWLTKVLTTGMGETTSDFLGRALNPAVAGAIGLLGLVAARVLQFRSPRYSPWIYWSAVVMVSVFGTMAADVVHVVAGVPYAVSTVVFAVLLVAVLAYWYATERTLSIHSISTPRRE